MHTIDIDGERVSSSAVRETLAAGDLEHAARLLGRPYRISGRVVHGDKVGRRIGFPTANLAADNEQFPPNGVYAVRVRCGQIWDWGVGNIVVRPTVHSTSDRLLEVHLLNFSGDLYGQSLEAEFLRFLRPEQKFPDVESLRQQIARDAEWVLTADAARARA
jgi:riboflavin kinase/FMN adenylyltransferase